MQVPNLKNMTPREFSDFCEEQIIENKRKVLKIQEALMFLRQGRITDQECKQIIDEV